MKYKKLTKTQILISLDRLTRFKYTRDKYIRVFFDIILSNLLEPQFSKNDLIKMDPSEIKKIVENIFNNSLPQTNNIFRINKVLMKYENDIFILDEYTNILLDNEINYYGALQYIDSLSPINLQWLKSLQDTDDLIQNRNLHCLKYPLSKIVLVEGITEELLLPAFSRYLGYDFYKYGIQVIPAGGKNQVVKKYYQLIEEVKIPIFLLLDKDAEDNINQILPKLRDIDKVHLVACGEFEDLLPNKLIIKAINAEFANFSSVSELDIDVNISKVKNLENIFKTKGLHEFKKANFAKLVRNYISDDTDISKEINEIVKEIFFNKKTLDSRFCSCYYNSRG